MRLFRTGMVGLLALPAALATAPTLRQRIKGAYFGGVIGDALCLGSHYEYDSPVISEAYGGKPIDRFYAPGERMGGSTHGIGWGRRKYHDKEAGENTDYGDYNQLVLEHLADTVDSPRALSVEELLPHWQHRMNTWRSWKCTQSKTVEDQLRQGVPVSRLGGNSNAMAIRNLGAFAYYDNEEDVVSASNAAMFTHNNPDALMGGEFFSRVTFRIIHEGLSVEDAIDQVAAQSPKRIKRWVRNAKKKVVEASDPTTDLSKEAFVDDKAVTSMARLWDVGKSEPIRVGKASPTEGTLPGSVYLILKYKSLLPALQANVVVGGDNASRAIAIGMVLGASEGVQAIPTSLSGTYTEWTKAEALLDSLPLLSGGSDREL